MTAENSNFSEVTVLIVVLLLFAAITSTTIKFMTTNAAGGYDRLSTSQQTSPHILRRRFPSWMKQIFLLISLLLIVIDFFREFHASTVVAKCTSMLSSVCLGAMVYFDDVDNLPFLQRKLVWMISYVLLFVFGVFLFANNLTNVNMAILVCTIGAFISAMLCAALDLKAMQINPPNAEFTCNLWNYITFSFLNNILIKVARFKKSLEFEDIPTFVDADSAEQLCDRFKLILSSHGAKPNLSKGLFSLVFYEWLSHGFCQFVGSSAMYLAPLALERILLHISHHGRDDDEVEALFPITIRMAVLTLFLGPMIKGIGEGQGYARGRHIGVRVKATLIGTIFSKAMRVDLASSKESVGKLNNLISVDVSEIQNFCAYSHYVWSTPYEIAVCCALLFMVLGQAAWGGILLMVLSLYVGYLIQKKMEVYQKDMMAQKDARMGIINEVLNSIRVIKFYAWEQKFMQKIDEIRKAELVSLRNYGLCQVGMMAIWEMVPALVGAAAFLMHVYLLGQRLTPAMGFTSVALFNLLRSPLMMFPEILNYVIKSRISMGRIISFVESADVKGLPESRSRAVSSNSKSDSSTADGYIEMKGVSLSWPVVQGDDSLSTSSSHGDNSNSSSSSSSIDMNSSCFGRCFALTNCCSSSSASSVSRSSAGSTLEKVIPLMDRKANSTTKYSPLPSSEQNSNNNNNNSNKFSIEDDEEAALEASTTASTVSTYNRVVLEEVTFSIPPKALAVVVGMTGSGKSTLLQGGLLGEGLHLNGSTVMNGSISYVSQSPWIQNATLKDNILFGSPFDQDRYDRVLFACSLLPDLKLLPSGDLTEIGEKGVNLSGGQQQRVSLARAAYAKSSIILLDDPLSAVDAHVGEHIFKELIRGFLKDRTRVLVSHNMTLTVPKADLVLCVDHFTHSVVACCPPEQLAATLRDNKTLLLANTSNRGCLSSFWEGLLSIVSANSPTNNGNSSDSLSIVPPPLTLARLSSPPMSSPAISGFSKHKPTPRPHHIPVPKIGRDDSCDSQNYEEDALQQQIQLQSQQPTAPSTIVEAETKSSGDVSFKVYYFYAMAAGGVLVFVVLIGGVLWIFASALLMNYSLGRWMVDLENDSTHASSSLFTYSMFVVSVIVSTAFKLLLEIFTTLYASKNLHDRLMSSVVLSPMRWFDATPIGRIINRFSQDIGSVDTSTMFHVTQLIECILGTLQIVAVISFVLPLLLLPFIPIIAFTAWVAYQYMFVSRELKRLESLKKSPVFVLFSESLTGLSIIRCFRHENRFFKTCCTRVDEMNRCHLYLWLCNRWLNFRMQFLGAFVAGSVGLAVVVFENSISSTTAAIVIIYSMSFCDYLTFLARGYAEVQMEMNSVERIQEYSSLDSEDYKQNLQIGAASESSAVSVNPLLMSSSAGGSDIEMGGAANNNSNSNSSIASARPNRGSQWPSKGKVEFRKIFMKYHSSSVPVLRDISFVIPGKIKVGVVGRTGAGKSSLIAALFRLVEPYSGDLLIDDVDVLQMPLHELRQNIAIVPQEPTLFKGSVRFNLDPFNQYSDDQLWAALTSAHLAEHILNMENTSEDGNCDTPRHGSSDNSRNLNLKQVAEKGSNFSVGQRQLLCMARAILRKAAVLVLDECTASVDHETDSLIQETVRNEMSDTTVICIAHRLRTIAYYDLILVMDKGSVAELDHPYTLIRREKSIFRGMCIASGEFEDLLATAEAVYNKNSSVDVGVVRNLQTETIPEVEESV